MSADPPPPRPAVTPVRCHRCWVNCAEYNLPSGPTTATFAGFVCCVSDRQYLVKGTDAVGMTLSTASSHTPPETQYGSQPTMSVYVNNGEKATILDNKQGGGESCSGLRSVSRLLRAPPPSPAQFVAWPLTCRCCACVWHCGNAAARLRALPHVRGHRIRGNDVLGSHWPQLRVSVRSDVEYQVRASVFGTTCGLCCQGHNL